MSDHKQTVAIVCGGGPAPGMNGVISAVTLEAHRQGWDVLGMYEGFSHLAKGEKKYVKLTDDDVSRIHLQGGCVLQMSRYNPTKKEEDLSAVVNTLKELGVTYLVTIGGDDTAFSSMTVAAHATKSGHTIRSVHVPKTIDNDLPLPEGIPTFGFETARALGALEAANLMEDARTANQRWYFVVAMGRTAGHLALGIGKAAGAPVTVIPEEFSAEKIRQKLRRSRHRRRRYRKDYGRRLEDARRSRAGRAWPYSLRRAGLRRYFEAAGDAGARPARSQNDDRG